MKRVFIIDDHSAIREGFKVILERSGRYTAVGDVVTLASRIQGLTRELHAAVAIDARTHGTAGDSATGFERHQRVRIRGRAEPVDIYSLPVAAA